MLVRAEKRIAADGLSNVEALLEMDAAHLRFADASFDAALAMFVITVVPDPDRVLSEMIRVVRPGGRLVLVNHFSVDRGLRALIERWLSRFSAKLGWRPNFPIERVLGRPQLRLVTRQPVEAFDLFTLLVFERV
jgi:phosphatidylethanolamine/phosphatidyl-N-methylethanolamine N-methyltransferase